MTDHKQLAVDLFNHTWSLLDTTNRTPEQDEEMVHSAHASRHHWGIAGTPLNHARGEWQIARVYSALKRFSAAAHHAQLYMNACKVHSFSPFDEAVANEGLARALVENDPERAKKCLHKAKNIGDGIENEEDLYWLHTNLDAISGELHDH